MHYIIQIKTQSPLEWTKLKLNGVLVNDKNKIK